MSTERGSKEERLADKACSLCELPTNSREVDHVLCDSCNGVFHLRCLGLNGLPVGPWHCEECREGHLLAGRHDVTLDAPLMELVYTGKLPAATGAEEYPRLLVTAEHLSVGRGGELLMSDVTGRMQVIPPICERAQLVAD